MVDLAGVGANTAYFFNCDTLTVAQQEDQNPFKSAVDSLNAAETAMENSRDAILAACGTYGPPCSTAQKGELTLATDLMIVGVSGLNDQIQCDQINSM